MGSAFQTTRWSLVQAAGAATESERGRALEELCASYWRPVFVFIRAGGASVDDAQELTQAFFADLLARRGIERADARRGRFRSFLLASVKNFLSHERVRSGAVKRGGRVDFVALPDEDASPGGELVAADMSPDEAFERQWARAVLRGAVSALEREMTAAGRSERFKHLSPFLTQEAEAGYTVPAAALEMSEGAVKVAVHRLRKRFGELLRQEVADTVDGSDQVEGELRHLQQST